MARGDYDVARWPTLLGLNESRDPSNMAANELVESYNVAGRDSSLGTRPGFNYSPEPSPDYTAPIATAAAIQALTEFSTTPDGFMRGYLLAVAGGLVYTDSSTSLTNPGSVQITSGAEHRWTFATFQDKIFACGGPDGDTMWWWDPVATPTAITGIVTLENNTGVLGTARSPKYIIQKWGRLFVAGMNPVAGDTDASYNPMNVRFHDIGQDPSASTAVAWPPENTLGTGENVGDAGGLASYGDEFITGFGEYTDPSGDWLMVGTNRGMLSVTRQPNTADLWVDAKLATGLVHQNAFVNLGVDGGDAIFMSDRGIHSVLQSRRFGAKEDKFLSWKIRDTFEKIDRATIQRSTGAYDPREGYVLFLVSTNGGASMNTLLCLDTQGAENQENRIDLTADTARWHIWDLADTVEGNIIKVARGPAGKPRIYLGTDDGRVGHMNRNAYADFGVAYAARFQTAHSHFGFPEVDKAFGDIWVDAQPGGLYEPQMQRILNYGQDISDAIPLEMPLDQAGSLLDGPDLLDSTFRLKGAAIETFAIHEYDIGRGVSSSLKFSHSGNDQPFFIANVAQQIGALGDATSTSTAGD